MKNAILILIAALMLTGCAQLTLETPTTKISYLSIGKRELKDIQITKTGDAWTASMASGVSKDSVDQASIIQGLLQALGIMK